MAAADETIETLLSELHAMRAGDRRAITRRLHRDERMLLAKLMRGRASSASASSQSRLMSWSSCSPGLTAQLRQIARNDSAAITAASRTALRALLDGHAGGQGKATRRTLADPPTQPARHA